ncbi:hypothetical protein [Pseudomonas phage vB_Pa-PAC2]|nr:hypothetical protein RVBP16_2370 [Pseudomonas phage sp. 30-2]
MNDSFMFYGQIINFVVFAIVVIVSFIKMIYIIADDETEDTLSEKINKHLFDWFWLAIGQFLFCFIPLLYTAFWAIIVLQHVLVFITKQIINSNYIQKYRTFNKLKK